ncbi:MAG: AhpC/TSA family protein, partial [Chitinophagaceae bacterium]
FLHAQEKPFTIKGSITNSDGHYIFLSFKSSNNRDSSLIKEGKFSFKGTLKSPDLISLSVLGNRIPTYLTFGQLIIKIEGTNFEKITVSGQKPAMEFNEIKLFLDSFQNQLSLINQRHRDARKLKDTVLMISLGKTNDQLNRVKSLTAKNWAIHHPNSLLSPILLQSEIRSLPLIEIETIANRFTFDVKESAEGKALTELIKSKRALKVLQDAPIFSQLNANKQPFNSQSLKGKYVLIEFWASWCVPCRAQNPSLVKLYDEFKAKNFEIVGISLDNDKIQWLNAIKTDRLPWINVSDLNGWKNEVAKIYGITSVPANFLIGPDQKIIAININPISLRKVLTEIIK